jgi:hypothetical protein
MQFDKQKLEPLFKDDVKVSTTQIRLDLKRLRGEWQKVLEEVVKGMG